jgi:hypothetical protein
MCGMLAGEYGGLQVAGAGHFLRPLQLAEVTRLIIEWLPAT